MVPATKEDHPTFEAVQDLFDQWRKEKKQCDRIPPFLWEAALALTDSHSVYAIAKRLRLNYTNFKVLAESRPGKAQPAFIEVGPLAVTIEMTRPTGERMTIRGSCNVGEIVREFWR